MRVEISVRVELILTRHLTEGAVAVSTIRNNHIIADLETRPERESHPDIGIVARGIALHFRVPLLSDLLEVIEPVIRPIDITAPTDMD